MLRLLGVIFVAMATMASADTKPVRALIPNAEVRGTAVFRFLGLPIYDARLFTENGAPFAWSENFGLELTYRRTMSGDTIVDATMRELKRLGTQTTPDLRQDLAQCFPSVARGDRFLAIPRGSDQITVWLNDQATCDLTYPDIKYGFLEIFLGDSTRSRSFTQKLQGS